MFTDPELQSMLDELVAQYAAAREGRYDGPVDRIGDTVIPAIGIVPLVEAAGGGYARYRRIMRLIERRLANEPCAAKANRRQDGETVWLCPECGVVDKACG